MLKVVAFTVFLAAFRTSLCDSEAGAPGCGVTSSYDLQYALANAAVCRTLILRANVTLTSDNFSAQGLTLSDQNITIQSDPTASFPAKLDFGTYTPPSTIPVTGNSSVTLRNLQLQNYLATLVQNGTATNLMPLFSFDNTASLHLVSVQMLMDAGRCASDANYSNLLYQPRRSW